MSATKRDNFEFQQVQAAGRAASQAMPAESKPRPEPTLQTLSLVSWNDAPAPGTDPYNKVGTRARP